jgi:hypothetical protein
MAAQRPSELAIRDLVAVSLATIATYRAASSTTTEVGNLAEVLAEVGYPDLASDLLLNQRAFYTTLDKIGDLAVAPGKRDELVTEAVIGQAIGSDDPAIIDKWRPAFDRVAESPYPGPMASPNGLREVRD